VRILVLTSMYPPHHLGGYELHCRDAVDRWRAAGHDVLVLTSTFRVDGVPPQPDEAGVRRELRIAFDGVTVTRPSVAAAFATERKNQRALRDAIEAFRPDVVSAWHMGAMSMGLLTTVIEGELPLVIVVCDVWPTYAHKIDRWSSGFARRPRLAKVVRRLTGLPTAAPDLSGRAVAYFATEYLRRAIVERGDLVPQRSVVFTGGLNLDEFPPVAPGDRPWRNKLLCAGRIEERKGVRVAVRALASLPEATLDILGRADPGYLDELQAEIRAHGLEDRVRFGWADRTELHARYADADVFLFPVLWDEPFGLVPLEAMAGGTPVIATGTGGSAEFLLHEVNCLLVPRDDPDALASAVRRLAADPDLRHRLVAAGTATAQELSVDRMASVLLEWHVAASERFASGEPAPHPPLVQRLADRGVAAR
jgi:glycogen synthase